MNPRTNPSNNKKPQTIQDSIKSTARLYNIMLLASLLLPFIGWGLAALINPKGWASSIPGMFLDIVVFFLLLKEHIFASLLGLVVLIAVLMLVPSKWREKVIRSLILLLSVIYTALIFETTATATEHEFTD